MANQTETIGNVYYTFTISRIEDVKRVLQLLNKHQLKLNGTILKWKADNTTGNTTTIYAPFKSVTMLKHITDNWLWMMERYGQSISTVLPALTMTEVKFTPPAVKTVKTKMKTKLDVKIKKASTSKEPLDINDFLEGPLDPNIPLSKQYTYIKAWRAMKKAEKLRG